MIKEGSYGVMRRFHLKDENSEPILLHGALTKKLIMKIGSNPVKTFDCNIEDPDLGILSYTVQDGDFDNAGLAKFEIEVTWENKRLISQVDIKEIIKPRLT